MIRTKEDLNVYMHMDAQALGVQWRKCVLLGKDVWRFERILRHYEYHLNVTHNRLFMIFWKIRFRAMSYKLGFDIPPNVFGPGLRINHFGNIVVSPSAKIGAWCDIHQGVNIGADADGGVPTLGNNVWIGPGAKLFGDIHIADNCAIGANAVVNKNFTTEGVSIAGVPAKMVSTKGNPYIRG